MLLTSTSNVRKIRVHSAQCDEMVSEAGDDLNDDLPQEDGSTAPVGSGDSFAFGEALRHLNSTPERIGAYRILREIGSGGMGTVYLAEQATPFRRDVALKLVRAGLISPSFVARFDAERQNLARMEHPNIARVYDGGTTPEGQPYFVMEHVPGRPLTTYCEKQRLSLLDRLELFLQVCEGVEHAHRKELIHRDLKPGNILVAVIDGKPMAKIIDFGIAKALRSEERVPPFSTVEGQPIGTYEYMSPEQASGAIDEIDTRTDVYALGVILYELLTGLLPIDPKKLHEADTAEKVRLIKQEAPAKPSLRLRSRSLRREPMGAEPRAGDSASVSRWKHLSGDLDWITLKALAKVPRKRYDSVHDFADDIRRHLNHEPVLAGPPSAIYKIRKFARKHPAALTAIGVGVLLSVTVWYAVHLNWARQLAKSHEYLSFVNEARDRMTHPTTGWTWATIEDLEKAASIEVSDRDPVDLRTEVASCVAGIDLRETDWGNATQFIKDVSASCLAFSPDGKSLAVAKNKGRVYCWVRLFEVDSWKPTRVFRLGTPLLTSASYCGIRAIAFSPDSRWLVAGMRNGEIYVCDTSSDQGKPFITLRAEKEKEAVHALAFSPDGKMLISLGAGKQFRRWDAAQGWKEIHSGKEECDFTHLAFHPNGNLLACGGPSGLQLLEASTLAPKEHAAKKNFHFESAVHELCFSPDGEVIAVGQNNRVLLVDLEGLAVFKELRDPDLDAAHEDRHVISSLRFNGDRSLLVSAANDRKVKLWRTADGRLLAAFVTQSTGGLCADFCPCGRHLVVVTDSGSALHEIDGLREQTFIGLRNHAVRAIDLAQDGGTVAVLAEGAVDDRGSPTTEVTLWGVLGGRKLASLKIESPLPGDKTPPVAFQPQGRLLAFVSGGRIHLWDPDSGSDRQTETASEIKCLSFSSDGMKLWGVLSQRKLGGVMGDLVVSWTVKDMERVFTWANPGVMYGLCGVGEVSAKPEWVLVGSNDGMTRLLKTDSTKEVVAAWRFEDDSVYSVSLSSDGSLAASGTQKGMVRIARLPSGAKFCDLNAHKDSVTSMAFGMEGKLLATCSKDRTVRLWHQCTDSFTEFLTLRSPNGPTERVVSLRLSLDGNKLALLFENERAVRLWHLDVLRMRYDKMGLGQ